MAQQREVGKDEHTLNIMSGYAKAAMLYGTSIDEFDYIDIAIDALRDIKHYGITEYIAYVILDKEGKAYLPCNLNNIDAVTTAAMGQEQFHTRVEYKMENCEQVTDDYYASKKIMDSLSHVRAKNMFIKNSYLSYTLEDNNIIRVVGMEEEKIAVAFTGIKTDDDGYPMITRKQANAIAAVTAKVIAVRSGFLGNKLAIGMLDYIDPEAARLKQSASIPEEITDNEIGEILNIQTCFNRKMPNRSSKYNR